MDIKSKSFLRNKIIEAAALFLCGVLFLASLAGFGMIYGTAYISNYGNGIDDLLLYDSYKESAEFQRQFDAKLSDILYLLDQDNENVREQLDQTKGFSYYASDGIHTVTNVTGTASNPLGITADGKRFTEEPAYLIYQNGQLMKVPESAAVIRNDSMKNLDKHLKSRLEERDGPTLTVGFSFDEGYLKGKEIEFARTKAALMKWFPVTILCGLLSLVLLIYLIAITGKKDENGNRPIYKIDRIFTEFQLLIISFLFVAGGGLFVKFLLEVLNYSVPFNDDIYINNDPLYLSVTLAGMIGFLSAGFGLYFILSVVRNIKAARFFKNSLLYLVISAIWRGGKGFYLSGSLMKKVVLITLALCILSATVVLAPFVAVVILVLAPKWVRKFEEVKKGVNEVKNGNVTYKIKAEGDSELDELARGINEISEASSIAIQNELKNQRLKTDLISNVSHDLKTPLTSIITYIDLLKREGLDNPEAPKYLEILDQKSIRLKKLTEDLFEAAKASSGAIPVKFEKVEMLSLINQGLGEMSDKIEASGLDFKINAQKEKYYVRADGQLLWRVVENLLSNVLKYAQEGSRVYIDLKEQNGKGGTISNMILEIKNISKTELNIDAKDLMERFKRGDESRATEGSGLGLAIAKDLVRIQNGWFEIKIDGDLFKAVIMLEAFLPEKEN